MKIYAIHISPLWYWLRKNYSAVWQKMSILSTEWSHDMNVKLFALLILVAPAALIVLAIFSRFQSGASCYGVQKGIRLSIALSFLSAIVAAVLVMVWGPTNSFLLGQEGLGLSLRIDSLSVLMFSMIAILSWVIFRFSRRYLEGDSRHGLFLGRMALTVGAVQLLVLSGNVLVLWLSWVGTSLALNKLLVFYAERRKARVAARKKFIMARLGDLALGAALAWLFVVTGSGQLVVIFEAAVSQTLPSGMQEGVVLLLVLAAIFKSAQFPTHSWLVEVMETPTPVSALLHAGLLNAGPFLITRFAFVMEGATIGPAILIGLGAFTAVFGSAAYLTQPSVKTALGYSSIAHMGFSLLTCGLGVYAAAMLHMVAHSFYKAHSFLSSGSVIDEIRAKKVTMPTRLGSPVRIAAGLAWGIGLYMGVVWLLGIDPLANAALLVVGVMVMLGIAQMVAFIVDARSHSQAFVLVSGLALVVASSFFLLERGMHILLDRQLPELSMPTGLLQGLMFGVLAIFTLVVFLQMLAPSMKTRPLWRNLGIHLRNGLYINALLDHWVGAINLKSTPIIPKPTPVRSTRPQRQEVEEVSV